MPSGIRARALQNVNRRAKMRRPAIWDQCVAAPVSGYGVFDGITIKTDSIEDSRTDRVMPILQEEQILMCRLTDRLKPDKQVLDVGTGSGVLGIYAAAKAGCRVVAIDISKRALRFAKANAQDNSVPVLEWPDEPQSGQISLFHSSLEEFASCYPRLSKGFDVILLNPPFNPTCPIVSPALHASAGPDGQGPFENQLRLVPALQKVGGYCIGYQMSYDRRPRKIAALAFLRKAYQKKCKITFAHALRDKKSVQAGEFLRAQYESFLVDTGARNSLTKAFVERYIGNVGRSGRRFSLIYYEVRRQASVFSRAPKEVNVRGLPNRTWKDRIWLHRCIVDHATRTEIS